MRRCGDCVREKARSYARAHPEIYRTAADRWRRENPEYTEEMNLRTNLDRYYGLTVEEYEAMLVAQDYKCAICRQPETALQNGKLRRLCVDHDHVTGVIRGLLCQKCNHAIGLFADDRELIARAAEYVNLPRPDGVVVQPYRHRKRRATA